MPDYYHRKYYFVGGAFWYQEPLSVGEIQRLQSETSPIKRVKIILKLYFSWKHAETWPGVIAKLLLGTEHLLDQMTPGTAEIILRDVYELNKIPAPAVTKSEKALEAHRFLIGVN